MFKTSSDRLNYSKMILPPYGYVLDKAIGTTYSLDLEALTAIAISLGLIEETDSELMNNPISMLNALQKVSDKILIFCEAGQIKIPGTQSELCILLEKMVVEVCLNYDKRIKRYPAFHPKMWLLVYINPQGNRKYRFVNLSRNLTFDRSWDISMAIDGEAEAGDEKTKPLLDFCGFLKNQIPKESLYRDRQRKLLTAVIKELEQVTFRLEDRNFTGFQIMPLGIGKDAYDINQDVLVRDTYHELVVVSPFLTGTVIEHWNKPDMGLSRVKRNLITRRSELQKLKPQQANHFQIYVLKDDIIDGEEALSDDVAEAMKQDIHAKMYLRKKYSDVSLYLGSMNASFGAMHSNVEMLIRLDTKNGKLNTDSFLADIFSGPADGSENPFESVDLEQIDTDESESSKSDMLEQMVKRICRIHAKAYVTPNGEKNDLRVEFDGYHQEENVSVIIWPLRSNKSAVVSGIVEFHDMDSLQLSQFYKIEVSTGDTKIERILMIPTLGMPENRENLVVQSIVKSKKSFIEYVAFVLGDDYLVSLMESKQITNSGVFKGREQEGMPAVYEKMLRTALENPEKLGEIQYLMKMIDDTAIIPEEFRKLYEIFKTTLKLK